jgi:hypothetical protein
MPFWIIFRKQSRVVHKMDVPPYLQERMVGTSYVQHHQITGMICSRIEEIRISYFSGSYYTNDANGMKAGVTFFNYLESPL